MTNPFAKKLKTITDKDMREAAAKHKFFDQAEYVKWWGVMHVSILDKLPVEELHKHGWRFGDTIRSEGSE